MAELPSVCEHIHLPVQAGASRTLQRMRRGYDREAYLEKVSILRGRGPWLSDHDRPHRWLSRGDGRRFFRDTQSHGDRRV